MHVSSGQNRSAEQLAREIDRAFSAERYPGDDHLINSSSLEAVEVRDFLRGRRWNDLRIEELARNHASLFFLTPEALRYYIPAFLIASVLHYDDSDQIPSTLLFLLNPFAMTDSDYQPRFRERFESLSDSERHAIRGFLEFLRDTHADDFPSSGEKDQASQLLEWWNQHEPQN